MLTIDPNVIEEALFHICEDLSSSSHNNNLVCFEERELWKQLTCCLLSSQIAYEHALSFSDDLDNNQLLPCDFDISDIEAYKLKIEEFLKTPNKDGLRYRFPTSKAAHFAKTAENIFLEFGSLVDILIKTNDIHRTRKIIIDTVHGFGPKQTSMYLRNIGYSDELAILDTHLVDFMYILGLVEKKTMPTSLSSYEKIESKFLDYSSIIGYSPACVDSAAWIVMRANKRG